METRMKAKTTKAAKAAAPGVKPLTDKDRLELFRMMVRIREFEEEVQRSYLEGLVHGTTHLCQGQEAVAAGTGYVFREDDYIGYTYRGHGHCLARGMDEEGAFAELFGRTTGVCGGVGGSMHLTDIDKGLIGAFGIVGGGLPVSVGAGVTAQLNGRGQLSATFFGDGATNIGAFHESMNIAQVWKLPVLFICENNLYGEFTRINHTTPYEDLIKRARGYDMNAVQVDGNDVEAVYNATAECAARARAGEGPSFIECMTYRHRGHSRTDPAKYRDPQEVEAWLARDPLRLYEAALIKKKLLTKDKAEALIAEERARQRAASERAAAAPWPEVGAVDYETLTFA
jgi:pyruvate dehydrogenase E1 component alpha subunit